MSQPMLPPEPVDDVLRDFFQSQMPKPWPAAPRTAEPSSLATRRPVSSSRARYTLAASVAVLLGTCWYLSGGPRAVAPNQPKQPDSGFLKDGSAKTPKEFEKPKEAGLNSDW